MVADNPNVPPTRPLSKQIIFTLTESEARQLHELAENETRSPSNYVHHLLNKHLKDVQSHQETDR